MFFALGHLYVAPANSVCSLALSTPNWIRNLKQKSVKSELLRDFLISF